MLAKRASKARSKLAAARAAALITALAACTPTTNEIATSLAASQGVPQVPAFLPMLADVPPSEALPIDGVWRISTIGKRVRIDRGRAAAIDPWLHALVLKVEPGMVVAGNIHRTGANTYEGEDLPLMGTATYTQVSIDTIHVSVQTMAGPVMFALERADDGPVYSGPPQSAPVPEPADCEGGTFDERTGEWICPD